MNKDTVKGKLKEVVGKVKEKDGHLNDDHQERSEGIADQVKGKVQKTYGKIKDKID